MMWTGTWNGWGGLFIMIVSMVVFRGGLIWALGYVVREPSRSRSERADQPSAFQILEERFARGEIDRNEFEERQRILSSSPRRLERTRG